MSYVKVWQGEVRGASQERTNTSLELYPCRVLLDEDSGEVIAEVSHGDVCFDRLKPGEVSWEQCAEESAILKAAILSLYKERR